MSLVNIVDLDNNINNMSAITGGQHINVIKSGPWSLFNKQKKLLGKQFRKGKWQKKYLVCKFYRRTQIGVSKSFIYS